MQTYKIMLNIVCDSAKLSQILHVNLQILAYK